MGQNSNKVKSEQLGMSASTAQHQLRKIIMFDLVKKCEMDTCYQCGEKIEDISNFSIEHITPWLHSENPKELFFSLDNIAFSHTTCNIKAGRRPKVENFSKIDRRGEKSTQNKLTEKDVLEIKKLINEGKSLRHIAKIYGVHHSLIGSIKNNKIWKHL